MQRYRNKYILESPKPPIPIFHIQNTFISKNARIIPAEKKIKTEFAFIGEKNIKMTMGKSTIPITLSNKKEKYTPNLANAFSINMCPKRRMTINLTIKNIAITNPVFQNSIGAKSAPYILLAKNRLVLISIIIVTNKVTLSVNTFSSFKY